MPRTIVLKRLYDGIASIRDYTVFKSIKNCEGILLRCQDEEMYLSPEDLSEGTESIETFTSKFDGSTYKLIDFKWKPSQKGLF